MASWSKHVGTPVLASEIVSIATSRCDEVAAVLAKHERWRAHYLDRNAARRRAAACALFVAYVIMFDQHGLRARTLIPAVDELARARPEFKGTDVAGHLRPYDQRRVENVVRKFGHWRKDSWDGGITVQTFGAIFFDSPRHPGAAVAFGDVAWLLHESIQTRLIKPDWRD